MDRVQQGHRIIPGLDGMTVGAIATVGTDINAGFIVIMMASIAVIQVFMDQMRKPDQRPFVRTQFSAVHNDYLILGKTRTGYDGHYRYQHNT